MLDVMQPVQNSTMTMPGRPPVPDGGYLKATYRIITDDRSQARRASVHDLSQGGIVLLTDRPIEWGTVLLIGFHDSPAPMLARVQHVSVKGQGQWSVCGSFAVRLTDEQLDALLAANSAFLAPDVF